jgi:hypothetical protein
MSLQRDLLYALDVELWARERLGLVLDPVQADLLSRRGHRELLNCCRQWGKTTMTAAGALHECVYLPGSRVVVVAPSLRQSSILVAAVERLAKVAGVEVLPLRGDDPGLRIGGGELVALPSSESTTRGLSGVTWLIFDEAARVSNDLYYSARAYLATTGGRCWLLSTPFGRRGFFFDEFQAGRYRATSVAAMDCARISAEFLAEQAASMPASWFAQEYCCEFTATDDGVFDHALVLASLSDEVKPLWD